MARSLSGYSRKSAGGRCGFARGDGRLRGVGAAVGLPLPSRAGGAPPAPRRWVGFDLRSGAGLETVMPTLRALYGLGPESGARRAEAAGTGERERHMF
ncbi:protein of unknown function [Kyrpidia spormannii]|uniref:Uncharacterized protein n=1 Tax=Kyrpidia spormannii TaxID=2055160 RepID=A0ACA8ZF38_9BACL|nr:protein of unknown function [Kyrpidia spormannii]